MDEIWKPVVGYKGLYEVSNLGRIKSLPKRWIAGNGTIRTHEGKILKQTYSHGGGTGYLQVILYKNNVRIRYKVHRLVAITFIGDFTNEGKQVDHINGVKIDNRLTNLRWVTQYENTMCNKNTPTTPEKSVKQYDLEGTLIRIYKSISEAARITNIDQASITRCCQGIFKHAGKFKWHYG